MTSSQPSSKSRGRGRGGSGGGGRGGGGAAQADTAGAGQGGKHVDEPVCCPRLLSGDVVTSTMACRVEVWNTK